MRFLLDSHFPTAVARDLRRRGIDAQGLAEWQGGNYRSAPDDQIIAVAQRDRRVFVTCDRRTVPAFLRTMAESGQHHAGVILVGERTVRPNDVGALVRLLEMLDSTRGNEDWTDRAIFLTPRIG